MLTESPGLKSLIFHQTGTIWVSSLCRPSAMPHPWAAGTTYRADNLQGLSNLRDNYTKYYKENQRDAAGVKHNIPGSHYSFWWPAYRSMKKASQIWFFFNQNCPLSSISICFFLFPPHSSFSVHLTQYLLFCFLSALIISESSLSSSFSFCQRRSKLTKASVRCSRPDP